MYNMYALERNAQKYVDRDRRTEKIQNIEYDYLAPDTINEMFEALEMLSKLKADNDGCYFIDGIENGNRPTQIIKLPEAVNLFKELITYYGTCQLIEHCHQNNFSSFEEIKKSISTKITRSKWLNIGGQLMQVATIEKLKTHIKSNKIAGWQQVHEAYKKIGSAYPADKLSHAYTSLLEILNITSKQFTADIFKDLLKQFITTKTWMSKGIYDSREKDYTNPFRKMVYDTKAEMENVIGKIENNSFIQQQFARLEQYKKQVKDVTKKLKL